MTRLLKSALPKKQEQPVKRYLKKHGVLRKSLLNSFDEDPEIVMTDDRYGFIAGIIKEVQTTTAKERVDISRNIDLVLTNRFHRISDIHFLHMGHVPADFYSWGIPDGLD